MTYERPMSLLLPPHPDIEIKRSEMYTNELKNEFLRVLNENLNFMPMNEIQSSLENRLIYWIIEKKMFSFNFRSFDPFLIENESPLRPNDETYLAFVKDLAYLLYLDKLNDKICLKIDENCFKSQCKIYAEIVIDFLQNLNLDNNNKYNLKY